MRRYGTWLTAATVSLFGTQVLGFAMAWVAAGRGGTFAGLVLTAINLPRVLLLLDRVLRPALALTAAAAAFLLPVAGLLVPLLARERRWPATAGGTIAGATAVGTAVVAGTVLVRGAARRPGTATIAGLMIAAGAVAALAMAPGVPAATGAGLVVGLGAGLFSAHLAPLVLGAAPGTHLARIQAVLMLAQSLPLLVTNNVLGGLADAGSASAVLMICASALATAATITAVRSDLPAARAVGGELPTARGDLPVASGELPAARGDLPAARPVRG